MCLITAALLKLEWRHNVRRLADTHVDTFGVARMQWVLFGWWSVVCMRAHNVFVLVYGRIRIRLTVALLVCVWRNAETDSNSFDFEQRRVGRRENLIHFDVIIRPCCHVFQEGDFTFARTRKYSFDEMAYDWFVIPGVFLDFFTFSNTNKCCQLRR